jgi:hypothetical protein
MGKDMQVVAHSGIPFGNNAYYYMFKLSDP